MRKFILIAAALSVFGVIPSYADSPQPSILCSFGALNLNVPFSEVDAVGLWNFKRKQGLGGAETPLLSYKSIRLTGGAVTSIDGKGAPFLRTFVQFPNPIGNFASFESLKPGIFVGRDFNRNEYIYGIASSLAIW